MYVLDSSAFIHEYHTDSQVASVPLVREELEGEHAYRFDALEGSGMHMHIPDSETVERIERAARETGDLAELSRTDLRLLAATFELDGRLVTDDYAMQNVAEKLDLTLEVIARDGIDEQRAWQFQCEGCGREFGENHDRCPICGSGLSRKNPA
jgi:UPF0271 protein